MEITYIIKKSRRRSISVHITSDEKVMVNAPIGTSTKTVEEFLLTKKNWIIKHLQKVSEQNTKVQQLGTISPEEIREIKKKAKIIIPERVEYYSKLSGIKYNKIFIRLQKSRWGSCSAEGNLNFNCLLVLMPLEVLDSVVVHELCHRHHMNHSRAFYEEVIGIYPEYRKWNKWLKDNGTVYLKRAGY